VIPYGKLIAAIILLVVIAGAYVQGRRDGTRIVTAEYAQRDLKAQADYQAKEIALQNEYRAKEQEWSQKFISAALSYEGKVKENAKALDIAISSGRLYDRFATASPSCGDSTGKTSADSPATRQAGTELSAEFDKFLKSEASRADKIVLDLNLCIGTLEAERQ